ncbi:MAG TPA: dihydrodipicolinate synthase family protein, partial [Paludibacter sp.]|nr:dihydrodipicolinate synthase family protein [Paludibacter sp.]
MINNKLTGMGVALITPFKTDETIDFDALARIVEHQIKNGTDYLVVCGTTAETPTLTEEEKDDITRFVVNCVAGRLPVVLGIGGNNTKAVVAKLQSYDFTGISAILS